MPATQANRLLFLFAALFLTLTPATAGVQWLIPEPATAEPPSEIVVRLFQGEPFEGEERPHVKGRVELFQRVWKSGRANLEGSERRFRVARPGVQLIGYSSPATGDYCKALVVVGDAKEGDPLRYSELGHRLEIVPQSDPVALLRRGGRLQVQLLFEREPLAGITIEAFPREGSSEGVLKARTDEIGLADFELAGSGLWMIAVGYTAEGEQHRQSATLVLRVGAGQ